MLRAAAEVAMAMQSPAGGEWLGALQQRWESRWGTVKGRCSGSRGAGWGQPKDRYGGEAAN